MKQLKGRLFLCEFPVQGVIYLPKISTSRDMYLVKRYDTLDKV
jgi:hypothetical protein